MNRTALFLGTAGILAAVALVVGLPKQGQPPTTDTSPPIPAPAPSPVPPTAASDGSIRLQSRLSHPFIPTGSSDLFLTVDLNGAEVPGAERSPVNFALVIDRSGSMSGEKLQNAKLAALQLVSQLGAGDRLAIVDYGSDVRSNPSLAATSENKDQMRRFIEEIWDRGGTNIGAGLSAAQSLLSAGLGSYRVNRMVLISDGQPTEGMTSQHGLQQLVRRIRESGISLSAIGVGTDFNEDLMQSFAELGAGSYGYLRDAAQLATLFQKDLQRAGTTVAQNVVLRFELPEGVELREVLGYPHSRSGREVLIPLSDFYAGQTERVVSRLSVIATVPGRTIDVASIRLAYLDLARNGQVESKVQVAATSTDRKEEVLARRDKDATVFAARAQKAANMTQAAQALKKGNRAEAQRYLDANMVLLDETGSIAGAGAVAEDRAEQAALSREFEKAATPEAIEHSVKEAKSKSLKSFGRMGSTY